MRLSSIFRGFRFAKFVGVLGIAASCANLVGLDKYEEVDRIRTAGGEGPDGNGGEAGDPARGEGGTTGTAGTSDGGEPSSAGDASVGGGAGNAGGAGGAGGVSDGEGGTPETGGTAPQGGTTTGGRAEGGTTGGTTPTGTCTLDSFSVACANCIETRCDSYCDICLGNPECLRLTECLQACAADDTCINTCFEQHPNGRSLYLDVFGSCGFTTCASDCGLPYGEPCSEHLDCVSEYCSTTGSGFCTNGCADDFDCPSGSWCAIDTDGFQKCMIECARDEDCDAYPGFACGYVSTFDDFAFPLCTAGTPLSAPCDSSSECASFTCTGPSGWCTTACTDNDSCAPGSTCVFTTSGDPYCLLDCGDQLDCNAYPDTLCTSDFDVEGLSASVCYF